MENKVNDGRGIHKELGCLHDSQVGKIYVQAEINLILRGHKK